jgi:hypothetical protein
MYVPEFVIALILGIIALIVLRPNAWIQVLGGVWLGFIATVILAVLYGLGVLLFRIWPPLAIVPILLGAIGVAAAGYIFVLDYREKNPNGQLILAVTIATIVVLVLSLTSNLR